MGRTWRIRPLKITSSSVDDRNKILGEKPFGDIKKQNHFERKVPLVKRFSTRRGTLIRPHELRLVAQLGFIFVGRMVNIIVLMQIQKCPSYQNITLEIWLLKIISVGSQSSRTPGCATDCVPRPALTMFFQPRTRIADTIVINETIKT